MCTCEQVGHAPPQAVSDMQMHMLHVHLHMAGPCPSRQFCFPLFRVSAGRQILVIKNALSPRNAPVRTSEVFSHFKQQQQSISQIRTALAQRDANQLGHVFAGLARANVYPTDLSTCCNLLRTNSEGSLMVIDFGSYQQVAMHIPTCTF